MSKGNPIFKFRKTKTDDLNIKKANSYLGLTNESAVVRILIQKGVQELNKFYSYAEDVTHPLKLSEIDLFTSSLKLHLKNKKRQEMRERKKNV